MIPSNVGFLDQDFEVTELPTKTYKMEIEGDHVRGYVDERDAMAQAVYRILNTERYQYVIYPWSYGIETWDLYGEPVNYVCAELPRRIEEALLVDTRILDVTDFEFDISKRGVVYTTFTVETIYGDIQAEKAVTI